jgi:hypothetical protein
MALHQHCIAFVTANAAMLDSSGPTSATERAQRHLRFRPLSGPPAIHLKSPLSGGTRAINPPVAMHGASTRRLRIESTNGVGLVTAQLQANAEFEALRLGCKSTGRM